MGSIKIAAALIAALSLAGSAPRARADDPATPIPSGKPHEGMKNESTAVTTGPGRRTRVTGVHAADPSEEGRGGSSSSLSPANGSSMGLGIQFDLEKPRKAVPPEGSSDDEEDE